jgi:hypothetical protein
MTVFWDIRRRENLKSHQISSYLRCFIAVLLITPNMNSPRLLAAE